MLPDRVSNPGPLTYESGALPIALRRLVNHGCMVWIEISVTRVTDQHHEACRGMLCVLVRIASSRRFFRVHTIYQFQYKTEKDPKLSKICSYGIYSKEPKNEFETAVVNEPSVVELYEICVAKREKLTRMRRCKVCLSFC